MIIIDSSSLILLAKIGLLDIVIENIKEKLTIPIKVYHESVEQKSTFDAKIIDERTKKNEIQKITVKNNKTFEKIKKDFNLGEGEAECITVCLESNYKLIVDDKKAINACKILKIKYITVPNILIQLYRKKIIKKQEAENYLKKLEKYGRYKNEIINMIKERINNEKNE